MTGLDVKSSNVICGDLLLVQRLLHLQKWDTAKQGIFKKSIYRVLSLWHFH